MAARAEIVPQWTGSRAEGRGQTTPKTAPPCASRTTILNLVLTGHRMSTRSPQSIPIKTHSFLKAKTHTNTSRPFCHTANTRAHLISCVGGVTTPRHCNHIRFKPSSASVQPYGPLDHTSIQCLINMASPLTSCRAPKGICTILHYSKIYSSTDW